MNKNPGWLFDIGDCTTQLCEDFAKPQNHYQDPCQPTSISWNVNRVFERCSNRSGKSDGLLGCFDDVHDSNSRIEFSIDGAWEQRLDMDWEGGREGGRESCVMTDLVLVKGVLSC